MLGAPTAAQTLQFPGSLGVEQEGRFDMSTRILRDAFSTIDNDISGIFLYPFEDPEATHLFLLGIGADPDNPFLRLFGSAPCIIVVTIYFPVHDSSPDCRTVGLALQIV